mmetsp:Transcript_88449/g.162424  ORF Transcript_88449/g.162424 Transcript_88449/m.162424 type:complete len:364 (+) Transcript_88449:301-1392(+)
MHKAARFGQRYHSSPPMRCCIPRGCLMGRPLGAKEQKPLKQLGQHPRALQQHALLHRLLAWSPLQQASQKPFHSPGLQAPKSLPGQLERQRAVGWLQKHLRPRVSTRDPLPLLNLQLSKTQVPLQVLPLAPMKSPVLARPPQGLSRRQHSMSAEMCQTTKRTMPGSADPANPPNLSSQHVPKKHRTTNEPREQHSMLNRAIHSVVSVKEETGLRCSKYCCQPTCLHSFCCQPTCLQPASSTAKLVPDLLLDVCRELPCSQPTCFCSPSQGCHHLRAPKIWSALKRHLQHLLTLVQSQRVPSHKLACQQHNSTTESSSCPATHGSSQTALPLHSLSHIACARTGRRTYSLRVLRSVGKCDHSHW